MFHVGFSTLGCPAYSVQQVADLARDSGFDGVEIRFIRGVVDLSTLPEFASPDHAGPIGEGLGTVAEDSWAMGVETLLGTHDDFSTSDKIGLVLAQSSDRLGVLWDFLHSWRHGEPVEQTYANLGDRIRQVHVKDSRHATPDSFDLVLTGTGIAPLSDLVSTLLDAGFDGYVDFEWEKAWHPELEEPDVAIPHFRKAFDRITADIIAGRTD